MATLVRLLLLKHAKTDICANDHIANIHDNDVQVSSVEFPHMVKNFHIVTKDLIKDKYFIRYVWVMAIKIR